MAANQGILSTCSIYSVCGEDLICLDDTGGGCTAGSKACTGCSCSCFFPYDDPNAQSNGGCIIGMGAGVNGLCFNESGLGCDEGPRCLSNNCSGGSVVSIYRFIREGSIDSGVMFPTATSTEVLVGFTGPSGVITPYKMFATSEGAVDTIYLVDHAQGLLSIQYDTSSGVAGSWITNIPYMSSGRTLIDAGYNGTTFIVAFEETVNGMTNDTVYSGTSLDNLGPFNPTSGSGIMGTQYTTGGVALSINYIDISPANDVSRGNDVLISINGTIYVKPRESSTYSIGTIAGGPSNGRQMTGLTGPARFYFDVIENPGGAGSPVCPESGSNRPVQCPSVNNIAFVGPFTAFSDEAQPQSYDQVLQFSGNVAGIALPIDKFANQVQYRVFDFSIFSPTSEQTDGSTGMQGSSIISLAQAYRGSELIDNVVASTFGGLTAILPYRIGVSARSVATGNNFYILSIGSCL